MFEIEKKFKLNDEELSKFLIGSEFLGEKTFTDVYYDTSDYALTKNDIWLRDRAGNWELKLPKHQIGKKSVQQYQEIEGEEKIREIFAVPRIKSFIEDIAELGHESFCDCKTTRKKYKKNGFGIDVDFVDYGDFSYNILEIELMVDDEKLMTEASEKIEKFAIENNLRNEYVRGKVLEYLHKKRPDHFQALIEAGVVSEV